MGNQATEIDSPEVYWTKKSNSETPTNEKVIFGMKLKSIESVKQNQIPKSSKIDSKEYLGTLGFAGWNKKKFHLQNIALGKSAGTICYQPIRRQCDMSILGQTNGQWLWRLDNRTPKTV